LGNSFGDIKKKLAQVTNPLAAASGTPSESLSHAIGRAIESVERTYRAVTLTDYETLAANTPGARIARVSARANLHPDFPCLSAQGIITVIVLPYLPVDRPTPSVGLRRLVSKYIFPRRIIGTRVEVIAPNYKEVIVKAKIKAIRSADASEVTPRVNAALNQFFHPLSGGADGTGWPFGRDVFRSEVLQLIDDTPGVDHVISLELSTGCGEEQCGNICLAANELVASGQHQIQVS
jgi:predicted phage baseplate assembly protein